MTPRDFRGHSDTSLATSSGDGSSGKEEDRRLLLLQSSWAAVGPGTPTSSWHTGEVGMAWLQCLATVQRSGLVEAVPVLVASHTLPLDPQTAEKQGKNEKACSVETVADRSPGA